jgi:hypothetical protein
MRYTTVIALLTIALPAAAQTPTSPVTGARPGNIIGTAQSLPDGKSVSNVDRSDTHSTIAPNLPSANLPAGSPPRSYLEVAQNALKLGRTGETQQALEQAETRILDRSVVASRADQPDQQATIRGITEALTSLAAGDRGRTEQIIADILAKMPS